MSIGSERDRRGMEEAGRRIRDIGAAVEDEARQQLEHLIQIDPDFVHSYAVVGYLDAGNGELASAIRWHRKAMQLDPGNGKYMESTATA